MASSSRFEEINDEPESSLHWNGYEPLRHVFIFGDSYSAIYRGLDPTPVEATDKRPLGVKWPGSTWSEPGAPNWVGHLVAPENVKKKKLRLHIYDYAIGGEMVQGITEQVKLRFLRTLAKKPASAPWTAEDSLFVFWIGINDCAYIKESEIPGSIAELMSAAAEVYRAGGRNFLFIDLPPIERTPAIIDLGVDFAQALRNKCATWNRTLGRSMDAFEASHPYATMFEFSAHDSFTRMLNNPAQYGLKAADVSKKGGDFWVDHIHPTSAVHKILANDIEAFLREQPQNITPGTPSLQPEP